MFIMQSQRYGFTNAQLLIIDEVLDSTLKSGGIVELNNCNQIMGIFSRPVEIINESIKIVEISELEINSLNRMFDITIKVKGMEFFQKTASINQVLSNPIPIYETAPVEVAANQAIDIETTSVEAAANQVIDIETTSVEAAANQVIDIKTTSVEAAQHVSADVINIESNVVEERAEATARERDIVSEQ
jgi:hypothetical protein